MDIALKKLLEYKNPKLYERYRKDHPKNKMSPQKALKELLKYFWIFRKHLADKKKHPRDKSLQFNMSVHGEMKEIDDMWHTFLLFTQDYMAFCDKYFGLYLHHVPTDKKAKKPSKEQYAMEFERYLSYLYDNLGAATLRTWFSTLLK